MSLLPREHGAYGQLAFPVLTAGAVAGVSAGGALVALAAVAAFLAHEPASVLLGLRGGRAARDHGPRAIAWLACCAAVALVSGIGALLVMAPAARWSLAVPSALALALAVATARGQEKSWHGEVIAALAFSTLALPVALAGGAPLADGVAVALPFALLFTASTLAVRVVVLKVRGGGRPAAAAATRASAIGLTAVATVSLPILADADVIRTSVLVAALPGLVTAALVAARPPAASRLRQLGWTLVGVTTMTAVIIIAAA